MKQITVISLLLWLFFKIEVALSADKVIALSDSKGKFPITIPAIDILSSIYTVTPFYSTQMIIALETINKSGILPDYNISIDDFDTACNRALGTEIFVRQISDPSLESNNQTLPLLLGPFCEDMIDVGRIAYHLHFVSLIGFNQHPPFYEKPGMYKNLKILQPSSESFVWALPEFLVKHNWKKVFYIAEQRSQQYSNIFLEECKARNITVEAMKSTYDDRMANAEPLSALESIVVRLKAQSARIIVFDSIHLVQLSCFMYKHGMYGPHYVFLQFNAVSFEENTLLRFFVPGCTSLGLHAILESVIFYGYAVNSNIDATRKDIFGMSTVDYEKRFLELMPEARQKYTWWMYRTNYYDFIMFSILALNKTAEKISEDGWKLSDWTLGSANYRTKPKYFAEVLMDSFASVKYDGLWASINKESDWNAKIGKTTFYQVQEFDDGTLKPLAIASHLNGKLTFGSTKPVWKTKDGFPPGDSMTIIEVEEPMVNQTASIVLLSFSIVMFILNSALLVANVLKRATNGRYTWLLNCMMLVGNYSFILVSVSIFAVVNTSSVHINCMVSLFLALFGAVGFYSAVGLRFAIAHYYQTQFIKKRNEKRLGRYLRAGGSRRGNSPSSRPESSISAAKVGSEIKDMKVHRYIVAAGIYILFFIAPSAVMFGMSPWTTEKILGDLQVETVDLAYQYYHIACNTKPLGSYSPVGIAFFAIALIMAAIPVISSSAMAVLVRNKVEKERVTEVGHVRNVQMITVTFIMATIIAMFAVSALGIGVIFTLMAVASLILSITIWVGIMAQM